MSRLTNAPRLGDLTDAFLIVRPSPVNTAPNAWIFFGPLITRDDDARQVLVLQVRVEFTGQLLGSLAYGISGAGRDPNPPLADVDDDEGAEVDDTTNRLFPLARDCRFRNSDQVSGSSRGGGTIPGCCCTPLIACPDTLGLSLRRGDQHF
jgi:hypothetical protein